MNIRVRGARTHNLKNVDLDLPRDRLIVLTGLSGSGKSSLAFDTLYAEGQRRYVESLSAYARQFLSMMDKPDVDAIEGLSPAIAIEQKATSHNPRSTVGTVTEIHDYLRLLFARAGVPRCPDHGIDLTAQTVSQMVDQVLRLPEGTPVALLAPVIGDRKGEHAAIADRACGPGFRPRAHRWAHGRARSTHRSSIPKRKHTIEAVVDRVSRQARRRAASRRIVRDRAARLRRHRASRLPRRPKREELVFSSSPRLPGVRIQRAAARAEDVLFQQPRRRMPDLRRPRRQGILRSSARHRPSASVARGRRGARLGPSQCALLPADPVAGDVTYKFDVETPWNELSEKVQSVLLLRQWRRGGRVPLRGRPRHASCDASIRSRASCRISSAVIARPNRRPCARSSPKYLGVRSVPGLRRHPPQPRRALRVRCGRSLPELSRLTVRSRARAFPFARHVEGWRGEVAARIVRDVGQSVCAFWSTSASTTSRSIAVPRSLSGGEAQRIRLASQVGSGLTGVMYILDEPSIGLHQRDNARLLDTLKTLRDTGNTVIVVEHDEDAIRAADHVVDLGPGAGAHGGHIVAQGTPAEIEASAASITGQYLSGKRKIALPGLRTPPGRRSARSASVGATGNNLRNIDGGDSAGPVHLRDRRFGLGQVDAHHRYAVPVCDRASQQHAARGRAGRAHRRAGADRPHHRHRSKPHRAHATLQSRDLHRPLRAPARTVCGGARSARARLRRGAIQLQREGRALRGLPGRRPRSRWRCTSCPTSTCPATSARASATTARRSRSAIAGATSTKCSR